VAAFVEAPKAYQRGLSFTVLMDSSFLFPRRVDSAIAGLEEAKNLAEESPPPDPDSLSDAELRKNLANLSNQFATTTNHRFQSQKRSQLFIPTHDKSLFLSSRCAEAIQIVRPSRSTAET
jgi:hypothetical protein